jgi:hypothetical protein
MNLESILQPETLTRERLLLKRYKKLVGRVQDATACRGDLEHYAELQAARAAVERATAYPGLVAGWPTDKEKAR